MHDKCYDNQDGCTALMWAARHNHARMVTLLLDRGARIDIPDEVSNDSSACRRYYLTHLRVSGWLHGTDLCLLEWTIFHDDAALG